MKVRNETGYSLIEVLVAVLLLSVAIIPMVSMFDAGLRSATTSSNYDLARTLANMKLEEAKSLTYDQVKSNFPSTSCALTATDTDGEDTCSSLTAPSDFPSNFRYSVQKQYLVNPNSTSSSQNFTNSYSATDTGLIKVTVTVTWNGNSYATSGVVTK